MPHMTNNKTEQRSMLQQGEAVQALLPTRSRIINNEGDQRFELPFHLRFDNLAYIGVVPHHPWHVTPHYHNHFELCYVGQGEGWFTINDQFYQVRQGDLFLTKPGEGHQGAASTTTPFRLYYLGFQLQRMNTLELDYQRVGLQRVAHDPHNKTPELFEAIFSELYRQRPHMLDMVQGLFLQLLVYVLRAYEQQSSHTRWPATQLSPSLQQLLHYLHEHSGALYTTDELAQMIQYSRSHLAREFKRQMGISLGQYVRSHCLECAQYYLRETSDTISRISEKLHFSSVQNFSMFFKRHTGLSPQAYRSMASTHNEQNSENHSTERELPAYDPPLYSAQEDHSQEEDPNATDARRAYSAPDR